MQSSKLTHTLSFGLDIQTGSGDDLLTGCLEARRIRNETNRLDRQGWEWDGIKSTVVDNADHVNNTTQLIVDKALGEFETYLENKDDGWERPYPYIDESYPMVMNHGEGYRLFPEDDGTVRFRITKRFKCCECEFQDHADRKTAVCVVQEWIDRETGNVPSLDRLPGRVRVMRRAASGAGGGPDSHGHTPCSGVTSAGEAQPSQGAREEFNSGASAVQD